MYDLRRLQHLANGARLGAVLALGLAHLQVSAQGAGPLEMPQRLDRFHIWVNGNIVTNKYASEAEEYGARMAQNARIYGRAETGGVSLSKQLAINTKNGVVVAEAVQKIGARQVAKAAVGLVGGPLGLAVLAGAFVIDWFNSAGVKYEDGVFKQKDTSVCTVAPCYGYRISGGNVTVSGHPSAGSACNAWIAQAIQTDGNARSLVSVTETMCTFTGPAWGYSNIPLPIEKLQVAPQPVTWTAATPQQVEDRLTAANPGPAVLKELADKGGATPNPAPGDAPRIENVQPSQEKTTTKTNPDGSTETTTCRTNGTSTGTGSIKLTESCTITQKDAQGNPTSTTTTNSDNADPVAKAEDSMLCTVFPKIAACAELDTPEGDIPTATETIAFSAENHFGGGSCPADKTMTLATTGQVMTVWNWTQACNAITEYFRPLFVTLCTLTALFILAPGVKEGA